MPSALAVLRLSAKVEIRRLHDRQVCRLFAFENPASVNAGLPISIGQAGSVNHYPRPTIFTLPSFVRVLAGFVWRRWARSFRYRVSRSRDDFEFLV
jgi:hypothetical protein